jgi:hypothetical protein
MYLPKSRSYKLCSSPVWSGLVCPSTRSLASLLRRPFPIPRLLVYSSSSDLRWPRSREQATLELLCHLSVDTCTTNKACSSFKLAHASLSCVGADCIGRPQPRLQATLADCISFQGTMQITTVAWHNACDSAVRSNSPALLQRLLNMRLMCTSIRVDIPDLVAIPFPCAFFHSGPRSWIFGMLNTLW